MIAHSGPTSGSGMRRPRRAACSAVMAPLATTLTGSANRRRAAATKARAASRSSTTANGGSASALNGTTGIRNTRPSGLGTCGPSTVRRAHGTDGHADAGADGVGGALDAGDHLAVAGGRVDAGGLVGPGGSAAPTAVDLDAAAHDDRLQRPALGGGAEDGGGGVVGELPRQGGCGPAEGFPHGDVHDDVRVERGDQVDDAVVVGRARSDGTRPCRAASGVGRHRDPPAARPSPPPRASMARGSRDRRPCHSRAHAVRLPWRNASWQQARPSNFPVAVGSPSRHPSGSTRRRDHPDE